MGYDKLSKDRMRKEALAKQREEKRWARRSGPVQTRFVCPECGGPHSKADHGARDETPAARKPTREEIEAARTPAGGWTQNQLAQWGVPWPPPKGWKKRLLGQPASKTRSKRGRGVPQEWTAAEQAIIDDASGKRAA